MNQTVLFWLCQNILIWLNENKISIYPETKSQFFHYTVFLSLSCSEEEFYFPTTLFWGRVEENNDKTSESREGEWWWGGLSKSSITASYYGKNYFISYFLWSQTPRHVLLFIAGVPKLGCCTWWEAMSSTREEMPRQPGSISDIPCHYKPCLSQAEQHSSAAGGHLHGCSVRPKQSDTSATSVVTLTPRWYHPCHMKEFLVSY